jgi:hypothetical protein
MDGSFVSAGGSPMPGLRTRYRRLLPEEDPSGDVATYNIVVMEVGVGAGPGAQGGHRMVVGCLKRTAAAANSFGCPPAPRLGLNRPAPPPPPSPALPQFCDRGTLRDAIRVGKFHSSIPGGEGRFVDLAALVEVRPGRGSAPAGWAGQGPRVGVLGLRGWGAAWAWRG